jgi:hypothetical protein
MSRISEIYAGWKNFTFPDPNVEQEAKRRMEICVGCKNLTKKNYCKLCGCYMPAKVRSPKSHCIIKIW